MSTRSLPVQRMPRIRPDLQTRHAPALRALNVQRKFDIKQVAGTAVCDTSCTGNRARVGNPRRPAREDAPRITNYHGGGT